MACKIRTTLVWMMVVVVVAMMVAENASAFDIMGTAEDAKDTAGEWGSWAYKKISGKMSVNPQNMKQAAEEMMHAPPGEIFTSGKLHAVSHAAKDDDNERFYAEAKRDAGPSYEAMSTKTIRED